MLPLATPLLASGSKAPSSSSAQRFRPVCLKLPGFRPVCLKLPRFRPVCLKLPALTVGLPASSHLPRSARTSKARTVLRPQMASPDLWTCVLHPGRRHGSSRSWSRCSSCSARGSSGSARQPPPPCARSRCPPPLTAPSRASSESAPPRRPPLRPPRPRRPPLSAISLSSTPQRPPRGTAAVDALAPPLSPRWPQRWRTFSMRGTLLSSLS